MSCEGKKVDHETYQQLSEACRLLTIRPRYTDVDGLEGKGKSVFDSHRSKVVKEERIGEPDDPDVEILGQYMIIDGVVEGLPAPTFGARLVDRYWVIDSSGKLWLIIKRCFFVGKTATKVTQEIASVSEPEVPLADAQHLLKTINCIAARTMLRQYAQIGAVMQVMMATGHFKLGNSIVPQTGRRYASTE